MSSPVNGGLSVNHNPGQGSLVNARNPQTAGQGSASFTSDQQSAYDLMAATLAAWGLNTLLPDLRSLIINGDTSGDTLTLALSQTDAYKQRFAGNEIRKANGLRELSPAEYIATEEQYYNTLQSYGLPKGFYDSPQDFTKFIANDISPSELSARAQVAAQQYMNAPDEWKKTWQDYFGLTDGDAIASILDPTVATQVIQNRAQQVQIGGTAAQYGFNVSQGRAQQFQQYGVTLAGAQKAYADIAQVYQTDQGIASRFGTTFDQNAEENSLLLNQADPTNKRQTLYGEEQGLFHEHGALSPEALGVSQQW